jgi:hypothetical protein
MLTAPASGAKRIEKALDGETIQHSGRAMQRVNANAGKPTPLFQSAAVNEKDVSGQITKVTESGFALDGERAPVCLRRPE